MGVRQNSRRKTFSAEKHLSSFLFLNLFVFLVLPPRFFLAALFFPHSIIIIMAPYPVELPRLRMRHALLEAAPELAGLLGESGSGNVGGVAVGGRSLKKNALSAASSLRSPSSPQGKRQASQDRRSSFDAEKTEEEQVVRESERERERERLFAFLLAF